MKLGKELPEELTSLGKLRTLFLQNNQLRALPEGLSNLQLTKLDVGFNKLSSIPTSILKNEDLEELTSIIPQLKRSLWADSEGGKVNSI